MKIILHGGLANGETHDEVSATCGVFTRYRLGPDARYKAAGIVDKGGRQVFKHWPLEPGVLEQEEGVEDA